MKNAIFLSFLLLISISVFSQEKIDEADVPGKVVQGFSNAFPDTEVKSWMFDGKNYFAEAKIDGLWGMAEFTDFGKWGCTHFEMKEHLLPGIITKYCSEEYEDHKIIKAAFVENADEQDNYQITLAEDAKGTIGKHEVFFDITGKFLKVIYPDGSSEIVVAEEKMETADEIDREGEEDEEEKTYLPESAIPADIVKYQSRKFPRCEDVKWDTANNFYIAYFLFRDAETIADFDSTGTLIQTTTIQDNRDLYPLIERYLEENHDNYRVEYAEKIVRKDRNNSYYVRISKRVKGKGRMEWECFFDKTGRIIKENEPEELYITKKDEEYVSRIDENFKEMVENEDLGEMGDLEYDQAVDQKELPTEVVKFIKNNYDVDYKITESYYELNEEMGNVYHVYLEKEGINQPYSELYFDFYGNILKKIDNGVEDTEYFKQLEEQVVYVSPPPNIEKNFERRYKQAEEVAWTKDGDNYKADYIEEGYNASSVYAPNGDWVSSTTEMDPDNLFSPIMRYIESNYKKYKIEYVEKTTKKNRKDFYYVELFSRRDEPSHVDLFFNKSGRIMEEGVE